MSGPPLSMDEAGNNWKGNNQGDTPNPGNFAPNNANNNFGSGVFPPSNQGSPAGNMQGNNFQGPPPGSNTPQYTASPAPSGSSTPGPPSSGFPPPQNNSGPFGNVNGPSVGAGPFGSPSNNGPQSGHFGRPGSSGPPFGPQPPFAPNNFVGGGPFPPGMGPGSSPFHGHGPGGGSGPHLGMAQPHPGMMGGPPQGVDRLDPRYENEIFFWENVDLNNNFSFFLLLQFVGFTFPVDSTLVGGIPTSVSLIIEFMNLIKDCSRELT